MNEVLKKRLFFLIPTLTHRRGITGRKNKIKTSGEEDWAKGRKKVRCLTLLTLY